MKNLTLLLFTLIQTFTFGQSISEVDDFIKKEIKDNNIPGLAVAVIKEGKTIHLQTYGYRDVEKKIRADNQTPFHIASVSKTVLSMGIFKLVEDKLVDLETDINNYLPFEVENPHLPNDKITIKRLLNHRSGILDNYEVYKPFWSIPKGDPTIELADFLKDYLTTEGKIYQTKHYAEDSKINQFKYSNTGYALLGLIIQEVAKMSLEEFYQKHFFQPLEMKNTSWFLKNLKESMEAKTYTGQDSTGLVFRGHNGYPDYPAGQLRTSISDFSKLIQGYLKAGETEFILKKETIQKITPTPSIAQNGFFTWYIRSVNNHTYYEHGGGDVGVRTTVNIDPRKRNAIIIFANREISLVKLVREMIRLYLSNT